MIFPRVHYAFAEFGGAPVRPPLNTPLWSLDSEPTGDLVINITGCNYTFRQALGYLPSHRASCLLTCTELEAHNYVYE